MCRVPISAVNEMFPGMSVAKLRIRTFSLTKVRHTYITIFIWINASLTRVTTLQVCNIKTPFFVINDCYVMLQSNKPFWIWRWHVKYIPNKCTGVRSMELSMMTSFHRSFFTELDPYFDIRFRKYPRAWGIKRYNYWLYKIHVPRDRVPVPKDAWRCDIVLT